MSDYLVKQLRAFDVLNPDGNDVRQRAANEITTLRARLEQAERERDVWKEVATKTNHLSEDLAHRAGFRAGIEAAAELCDAEMYRLYEGNHEGYGAGLYDEAEGLAADIRALSPTDNAMTVAEAAKVLLDARSPDGLTVLPNYVMILLRALASHTGNPND